MGVACGNQGDRQPLHPTVGRVPSSRKRACRRPRSSQPPPSPQHIQDQGLTKQPTSTSRPALTIPRHTRFWPSTDSKSNPRHTRRAPFQDTHDLPRAGASGSLIVCVLNCAFLEFRSGDCGVVASHLRPRAGKTVPVVRPPKPTPIRKAHDRFPDRCVAPSSPLPTTPCPYEVIDPDRAFINRPPRILLTSRLRGGRGSRPRRT